MSCVNPMTVLLARLFTRLVYQFDKATRLSGRSNHVAHLEPPAVSPQFHGRGSAAAMLTDVIARLEHSGVLRFELLVEADNPRGIAFYRQLGFEREGVQRSDYVDEVMMVKFASALA
jgi:ribosomal protein S18 acetylase RimI-like enzyme